MYVRTGERSSHKHKTVTHDHHLVGLDQLLEEEIRQLEVVLGTDLRKGTTSEAHTIGKGRR